MLKKVIVVAVFFTLWQKGAAIAGAMPVDSVGQEKRNGKVFVVHKVMPKETLFALSRKYSVPVAQIVDANPNIQSGLSIGQIVYVPSKTAAAAPATAAVVAKANTVASTPYTYVVDAKGNKIHQVTPKQTLYSIARMYNISAANIRKWNGLTSDNLNVGDDLIVGIGAAAKPTSNPQYVQEVDDEVEKAKNLPPVKATTSRKAEDSQPVASAPPVAKNTPVATASTSPEPIRKETISEGADRNDNPGLSESVSKVIESGLAELIDNNSNNNKYLALHKSAPVGSILQVKNIMNGQSVYVRVIGKLPETGNNDKVVVKISKRAFQKLASLDNRFRVEVSYMP